MLLIMETILSTTMKRVMGGNASATGLQEGEAQNTVDAGGCS
jgi:hypothetical protein